MKQKLKDLEKAIKRIEYKLLHDSMNAEKFNSLQIQLAQLKATLSLKEAYGEKNENLSNR
ncbi:MAG: hypothetical protein KKH44_07795 [Bacteroidetes bacterium]|nr:hypothetical protein [Bacteroidota bacterium]